MSPPSVELLDPKIDLAFKALFGREANKDLLASLLGAILDLEDPIAEIEILSPFDAGDAAGEKVSILDLRVRDRVERRFAIEMQCRSQPAFAERILYYAARLLGGQLGRGQSYGELEPVIVVVFTNYVLFPEAGAYHSTFGLWDSTARVRFSRHLRIDLVQLPRFDRPVEEARTLKEQWVAFLKEGHVMKGETLATWAPEVVRAREELERLSADPALREQFEDRIRALRDYVSDMEGSRREGMEEGMEKGKREAAKEFARRLLERGFPAEEAANLTGIRVEDVERLARE